MFFWNPKWLKNMRTKGTNELVQNPDTVMLRQYLLGGYSFKTTTILMTYQILLSLTYHWHKRNKSNFLHERHFKLMPINVWRKEKGHMKSGGKENNYIPSKLTKELKKNCAGTYTWSNCNLNKTKQSKKQTKNWWRYSR